MLIKPRELIRNVYISKLESSMRNFSEIDREEEGAERVEVSISVQIWGLFGMCAAVD
jgi:hypothetical protein